MRKVLAAFGIGVLLVAASFESAHGETLRWTKTYNGVINGWDEGQGVAVAADGSVYVTGNTYVGGQQYNLLLQKYSSAGALLWKKTYNGAASGEDVGYDVAVATDGGIYVTGYTYVAGQEGNLLLLKYSSGGTQLWAKTYNGVASGWDAGYGVAVAADGSVYVTGYTYAAGIYDVILQKYSPAGSRQWTRAYNGTANDWDAGFGVAVASDGCVYVTGYTSVGSYPYLYKDLFLRKYSAAGTPLWMRTYDGVASGDDAGYGVAVSADGSIYVAGKTYVAGQEGNLLLRKYSAVGTPLWTKVCNGVANGQDTGYGVAVSAKGYVYVIGKIYVAEQESDLFVRKYSAAGGSLWTTTYNGVADGEDAGYGIAVAGDGSVYMSGFQYVEGQQHNLLLQKYK